MYRVGLLERSVVQLNFGVCHLVTGTPVGTVLTVPVRTSMNCISSEEERCKTAPENLSPVSQEPGFGIPEVLAKPVSWGGSHAMAQMA